MMFMLDAFWKQRKMWVKMYIETLQKVEICFISDESIEY